MIQKTDLIRTQNCKKFCIKDPGSVFAAVGCPWIDVLKTFCYKKQTLGAEAQVS